MKKNLHILYMSLLVLCLAPVVTNAKTKIWNNIIDASGMGKVENIKNHLKKGASVNYKSADGETPLMSAVTFGKLENVKFLIGLKADVNARDNDGESALVKTCWATGNMAVAKFLISHGAIASEQDVKLCRKLKRPYMATYFTKHMKK